jgi:hypothetical protein
VRKMLFYRHRHLKPFRGHDLKVWDYFNHVLAAPGWTPYVHFAAEAQWGPSNPWSDCPEDHVLRGEMPFEPDALFLSGLDWYELEPEARERPPVPVVNLVQGVRNASPDDESGRYAALAFKAVRICVSPAIEAAIHSSGQARGPVMTIPVGIDLERMPPALPHEDREIDLLIVANKEPQLGRSLLAALERPGRVVEMLEEPVPRKQFLELVAGARTAIFLPKRIEGPYLPALEGMALGTLVICPEGVGPFYCKSGVNCLRPPYEADALRDAAEAALSGRELDRESITEAARRTAEDHDLRFERERFLDVLGRLDELWRSA